MNAFLRTVGANRILFLIALLMFSAVISSAQQDYVGRYNIYTGFSDQSRPEQSQPDWFPSSGRP